MGGSSDEQRQATPFPADQAGAPTPELRDDLIPLVTKQAAWGDKPRARGTKMKAGKKFRDLASNYAYKRTDAVLKPAGVPEEMIDDTRDTLIWRIKDASDGVITLEGKKYPGLTQAEIVAFLDGPMEQLLQNRARRLGQNVQDLKAGLLAQIQKDPIRAILAWFIYDSSRMGSVLSDLMGTIKASYFSDEDAAKFQKAFAKAPKVKRLPTL